MFRQVISNNSEDDEYSDSSDYSNEGSDESCNSQSGEILQ